MKQKTLVFRTGLTGLLCGILLMSVIRCNLSEEKYSDELFYSDIAWGIMKGLSDIWNQYIAGTPVGSIDINAEGPFGGTVHITGTTSYSQSNGIETVHLEYEMSDCRISSTSSTGDLNVDLTLNGVISEDGSFSSTYTSLSYKSEALRIDGTAKRGTREREVHGTTSFKANRTSSGISAELFGFKVYW
jgi:hypothetical protein